ncbi:transposase [Burkholderia ubonensis]|uniref:transposase n=1 Tax=Burkholderia ubonensis TaxID=101571 RepID=UPI0039F5A4E0
MQRQYSTGGKSNLLGISKRGDKNIRHLLVQCARAFMLRLDLQKESFKIILSPVQITVDKFHADRYRCNVS